MEQSEIILGEATYQISRIYVGSCPAAELAAEQLVRRLSENLGRLGRDMRESSYYAEQFFPEHGIHYIAIGDNFDTERENVMVPFLFAMNEVYLRDGSRKVKDVLRSKR